jgi:hypothetical protein
MTRAPGIAQPGYHAGTVTLCLHRTALSAAPLHRTAAPLHHIALSTAPVLRQKYVMFTRINGRSNAVH